MYGKGNQPFWSIYSIINYIQCFFLETGKYIYAEASWQYELAAKHHNVDVNGHVQLSACLLQEVKVL